MSEACCTCATLLSSIPAIYNEKSEKPILYERRLECCNRAICVRCYTNNPRFSTYCPYCQVSTVPSPLSQGLRDPPAYSPPMQARVEDEPPPYSTYGLLQQPTDKPKGEPLKKAPDVLHFVDSNDSISSLSLQYGVPVSALRTTNGLYADSLLAARRTILIPGEYYKGGVSLSPRPPEGEEEEIRKGKVRKFMVSCKVAEYDVALLYLQQEDYDLTRATEAYKADEQWERDHPMEVSKKGKSKMTQTSARRKWFGTTVGGLAGQI